MSSVFMFKYNSKGNSLNLQVDLVKNLSPSSAFNN